MRAGTALAIELMMSTPVQEVLTMPKTSAMPAGAIDKPAKVNRAYANRICYHHVFLFVLRCAFYEVRFHSKLSPPGLHTMGPLKALREQSNRSRSLAEELALHTRLAFLTVTRHAASRAAAR